MVLNLFKLVSLKGLVIALFLMPSLSHSAVYMYTYGTNSAPYSYVSAESACQAYASQSNIWWANYSHIVVGDATVGQCWLVRISNGVTQNGTNWYGSLVSSCPDGYQDDGNQNCVIAPTCNLGDILYSDAPLTLVDSAPRNVGGCEFVQSQRITCFYSPGPDETQCSVKWQSTGNSSDLPEVVVAYPEAPAMPSDATKDNTKSTSDSTVSPPNVSTAPDGTVTTEQTETIAQTDNAGTQIWESDEFIFVKDSTGTTTITQKGTTTVSNPDGSSTVQEQQQVVKNTPDTGTSSIPKDGNQPTTITNTYGDTFVTNDTITTNYDSAGNQTSQESTSDTSSPDPEPPTEEQETAQYTEFTGDSNFDTANTQVSSDIAQAKTDLLAEFNRIRTEASSLISFNGGGSGALPCPPPVEILGFGNFSLCLTDHESQLSQIPLILLFIASFLGLAIILR